METILLSLILVVGLVILYFQIKNRPKQEENLNEKIKEELNSIKSSFSDSFGTMSRDIAKDLANEVPTSKDPMRPGPFVKEMASKSCLLIPAC